MAASSIKNELTELGRILRDKPDAWRVLGDLCEQVVAHAVEYLRDNTAGYQSVVVGLERRREELGFALASGVERLLIEQILTCWVQCSVAGLRLENVSAGQRSIEEGLYLERRYDSAQARLIRSIESLARIRKLNLPNVQLNIAEKQVNITG